MKIDMKTIARDRSRVDAMSQALKSGRSVARPSFEASGTDKQPDGGIYYTEPFAASGDKGDPGTIEYTGRLGATK